MDNRRASSNWRTFFYNGSEYLQKIDLALPGRMPIIFQRTYNNQSTFDSPLGYGWDFSFNERLRTYSDNSIVIRTATGRKLHFIFTGGVYICEENPQITLEKNLDGSFVFYANPIGNRYYYDREGRLTRKQSVNGESLRMTYSNSPEPLIGTSQNSITPDTPMIVSYNYQLQRIEQFDSSDTSTGRYLNFTYNGSSGRLTSITDSTGRTITYQHDSLGNLIRIDYPEELFVTYEYTDPNDFHNMTDNLRGYGTNPPVLQTSRQYDADDRITQEEHAGGILEIDYTIPFLKTTVHKTVVDDQENPLHNFDTVYTFNNQGFPLQTITDELSLELKRDNRNNITERILWENNGSATNPDLVKRLSAVFTYDDNNQMIRSSVDAENGTQLTTDFSYKDGVLTDRKTFSTATPEKIHQILLEYNYKNSIPTTIAVAKTLTSTNPVPAYNTVSFEYDETGSPTAVIFENGDRIESKYERGFLINRNGFIFNYDTRGNISSVTDRNGNTTQYEYDAIGRVTKIINALNDESLFTYTGWNLSKIEVGKRETTAGLTTNFRYDNYNRLVESSIDLAGSPIMQSTNTFDSAGNLLSVTDQNGNSSSFEYDPWNHPVRVTDADGYTSSSTYSYTGQLASITHPNNNVTSYVYDTLGRVAQIIDSLGGTTSFQLDEMGQVTDITDSEERHFQFEYDLIGRTTAQYSLGTGRTLFSYDKRGRLNNIQYAGGTTKHLKYNSFNLVEQVTLKNDASNYTTQLYGYDRMGNLLWYNESENSDPIFTLTYDPLNRLASKTINPIQKTMNLEYTATGQREKLTVTDNTNELFNYSYAYDTAGFLKSITESPGNISTTFVYDNRGLLVSKHFANGIVTSLAHSRGGLLTDLHYKTSDDTTIAHYQYAFTDSGTISSVTDSIGETQYGYDQFNRLQNVTYPNGSILSNELYTYDLTGNRLTSASTNDWSYDNGGRLLSYNGHTFSYNDRGQQVLETVGGESTTFSYDSSNRLHSVSETNTDATYSYDFSNRLVKKTIGGNDTWYLYDGAKILAEFNNSGQLQRNYNLPPGNFDLLGITEANTSYTALTNHQQTPVYVSNNAQTPIWKANYQAFGKTIIDEDVDNNGITFSLSHRFPGQYYDEETGLNYNWHRFYNTETGRYISPDPIGLNGGINLYGYSSEDPFNRIDPDGLKDLTGARRRTAFWGTVKVIGGGVSLFLLATATAPVSGSVALLTVVGGYVAMIIGGTEVLIAGTGSDSSFESNINALGQAETCLDPLKQVVILGTLATGSSCEDSFHYANIAGQVYNIKNLSESGLAYIAKGGDPQNIKNLALLSDLISTRQDMGGTVDGIKHFLPINSSNHTYPHLSTNRTSEGGVKLNVQRITLTPEFQFRDWVQQEILRESLLTPADFIKKHGIIIYQH